MSRGKKVTSVGVDTVSAFVTTGPGSYDAMSGEAPCLDLKAYKKFATLAPKIDAGMRSASVEVWRARYADWFRETYRDGDPVTPAAFARRVRDLLGLGTTPSSKRVVIDGRRRQYRIFVAKPRVRRYGRADVPTLSETLGEGSLVPNLASTRPFAFTVADAAAYREVDAALKLVCHRSTEGDDRFENTFYGLIVGQVKKLADSGHLYDHMRISNMVFGYDCFGERITQKAIARKGHYMVDVYMPADFLRDYERVRESDFRVRDGSYIKFEMHLRSKDSLDRNGESERWPQETFDDRVGEQVQFGNRCCIDTRAVYIDCVPSPITGERYYREFLIETNRLEPKGGGHREPLSSDDVLDFLGDQHEFERLLGTLGKDASEADVVATHATPRVTSVELPVDLPASTSGDPRYPEYLTNFCAGDVVGKPGHWNT